MLPPANWVNVDKGTFLISSSAVRRHGNIKCSYTAVVRFASDDDVTVGETIRDMVSGTAILSDVFEVECHGQDGDKYRNIHIAVAPLLQSKVAPQLWHQRALGYNIVILGLYSVSSLTWKRSQPKTYLANLYAHAQSLPYPYMLYMISI